MTVEDGECVGDVLVPEADIVGTEPPAVVAGVEVVGDGEDAPY